MGLPLLRFRLVHNCSSGRVSERGRSLPVPKRPAGQLPRRCDCRLLPGIPGHTGACGCCCRNQRASLPGSHPWPSCWSCCILWAYSLPAWRGRVVIVHYVSLATHGLSLSGHVSLIGGPASCHSVHVSLIGSLVSCHLQYWVPPAHGWSHTRGCSLGHAGSIELLP
jgi:hypothetical protein